MSMLTKESILAQDDKALRTVAVPEWGGELCVRVMTGAQRDVFEGRVAGQRKADPSNISGLRALLVSICACDEQGKRLFGEADIPALEGKSSVALQRVFDAAAALNGIAPEAVEEARSDFTDATN
jgi:hypothetical protein